MPRKAMRSLSFIFFLLMAISLAAGESSYTIREGETLFSVAKRAQIPVDVLSAYNGIDNASRLKAGSVIRFPSPYVVKRGDTLFAISRSFGVPMAKLLDLNGLNERSKIKVGLKVYIPLDHAAGFTASSRGFGLRPTPPAGQRREDSDVRGHAVTDRLFRGGHVASHGPS